MRIAGPGMVSPPRRLPAAAAAPRRTSQSSRRCTGTHSPPTHAHTYNTLTTNPKHITLHGATHNNASHNTAPRTTTHHITRPHAQQHITSHGPTHNNTSHHTAPRTTTHHITRPHAQQQITSHGPTHVSAAGIQLMRSRMVIAPGPTHCGAREGSQKKTCPRDTARPRRGVRTSPLNPNAPASSTATSERRHSRAAPCV